MIKKFLTLFIIMIAMLSSIAYADVFQGTMLRDSITLKSGVDITATGGASDFDYSASTGAFKFPSGVVTMGAGAMALHGATTIENDTRLLFGTPTVLATNYMEYVSAANSFNMNGVLNFVSGMTINGGADITMAAGDGLLTVGTGGVNSTSSPINMLQDVTLASGKDIAMSGTSTLTTGTGAIGLNGNVTIASAMNLSMSGASSIVVGTRGIDSSGSTLNLLDDVALASGKDLGMSGAATLTTGTGSIGLNGPATFADTLALSVNATTTINTTLSSVNTKTVYGIDASGGNKSLILPDASTVNGRMYMLSTNANAGANHITITATGGDVIGGAASKVSNSTFAGLTLVSDGTRYLEVGTYGTWI